MKLKRVRITDVTSQTTLKCSDNVNIKLGGYWLDDFKYAPGMIVNLIDFEVDVDGTYEVNDAYGFIIVNPDILINATSLSNAFGCMRRSLLTDLVRHYQLTPSLLYGNMVHSLLQSALADDMFTPQELERLISTILENNRTELEMMMISMGEAHLYMKQFIDKFVSFQNKHKIKVADIEENYWSIAFGIKGKVDVTMWSKSGHTVPLEVKSGGASITHRAQVTLYALMMYEVNNVCLSEVEGWLYYTRDNELKEVPILRRELVAILHMRNKLSVHHADTTMQLPAIIKSSGCIRCYSKDICMVYHKANSDDDFGVGCLYDETVGHLSKTHLDYFKKWERLITYEEQVHAERSQIWTQDIEDRIKQGKCLSNLTCCKIKERLYLFEAVDEQNMLMSNLAVGDSVVLTRGSRIALALGFVMSISPDEMLVQLDREFDKFQGQNTQNQRKRIKVGEDDLYRIDRDDMSSGLGMLRHNLKSMFMKDGDNKRLRLLVDEVAPSFTQGSDKVDELLVKFPLLNVDQIAAIKKVVSADDYQLTLGTPGSGKSYTIACLVSILVSLGKSVLLTSYTHSAVDNILIKLKESGTSFVRIASSVDKVHPEIKQYMHQDFQTTQRCTVVGMTCLSSNSSLMFERKFDYCIVDEASQIPVPVALGPIRLADVFCLVGDTYQLPPIVKSLQAQKGGYGESLFDLLEKRHPQAVSYLRYQYRMTDDIMQLSNYLTYDQLLKTGSKVIGQSSLDVKVDLKSPDWIQRALEPKNKILLLNTDDVIGAVEQKKGDATSNKQEVLLIERLVDNLIAGGIAETEIGLMSPYRSQVRLLKDTLLKKYPLLECLTVDKYQGRDKQCAIVSLVRSNIDGQVGDLLKDRRRLNVALTRAKYKLLLVGSIATLKNEPLIAKMINYLQSNGQVLNLHADVLQQEDDDDLINFLTQIDNKENFVNNSS